MADGDTLPVTTDEVVAGAGGGGAFPPAASVAVAHGAPLIGKNANDDAPESFDDSFQKKDQLTEKRPERRADPIDEAVDSSFWSLNGSEGGWLIKPKKGSFILDPAGIITRSDCPFTVTRWYIHKRVAIDFPRTEAEEKFFELKRDVLRKLGVAAVCIPSKGALSGSELKDAISREWANVTVKPEKKKGVVK